MSMAQNIPNRIHHFQRRIKNIAKNRIHDQSFGSGAHPRHVRFRGGTELFQLAGQLFDFQTQEIFLCHERKVFLGDLPATSAPLLPPDCHLPLCDFNFGQVFSDLSFLLCACAFWI
jgi:hypothetical protein